MKRLPPIDKTFEQVVKAMVAPKPMKFEVVLNAANPIFPMQLKKAAQEIGINISAFQSITIFWTDFTASDVQMKLIGKPEYKGDKIAKGGIITYQLLNEKLLLNNPARFDLDPKKNHEQLLFFLVNKECVGEVKFTVLVGH